MKEQITLIFALHEQDLKAQNLQKALDAIAPELQQLETLVATNRSQAEQKSAKMAELETLKRSKERDVETSEARQKDFQGKLSTIKTNKEYQAALKEISETKKINKATEDQILEVMTQLDGLKTEKQAADEALTASEANLEKRRAELSAESERLMGMLREVESEKKVIAEKVDPALMVQYQRVRKGRAEAVSEVSGGTCQGCRMRIPPQLYIEIQKMKTIHVCPSCQRLLYMPEWLQKKTEPKTEN
ncbi:MAG TPA: C4-type zinc ribbon domain-containing protein [bacterium]|nr:C4-type zinc ribbon domain-containing protein [bacterium]